MPETTVAGHTRATVGRKAALLIGARLAVFAVVFVATAVVLSWTAASALWGTVFAALALAVALKPLRLDRLVSVAAPCADPDAARARLAAEDGREGAPLNPLCRSFILAGAGRASTCVVLFHGVSNCPRSFSALAPRLQADGHGVVAWRMPRNGYADQSTDALDRLRAEELVRSVDAAVDCAAGLAEEVIVAGISAGGTLAAWAAQTRPDVARAVLVAPLFGLSRFGPGVNGAVMRLGLVVPPISIWKDPVRKREAEVLPHAYRRQSSRGTAELLRLSRAVRARAGRGPAAAKEIVLVLNAADTAVDNRMALAQAAAWRGHGTAVTTHVFACERGLPHELIDPAEAGAHAHLVYPVLLDAIAGRAAVVP
ncbi:MAG: alpha/beta fold hydrolase [Alphaproteobacteria bacterium]|nr:alpha/beta fold hydrolase [Alphaproteobacteria bacterium]